MRRSTIISIAATAALSACGPIPPSDRSDRDRDGGASFPDAGPTCPQGQSFGEYGCEPMIPEGECAPGTAALLGSRDCARIGRSSENCPPGFAADPSGWGCTSILPAAECPPGTRAALGSTDCIPTGWTDCPSGFAPTSNGWGCDAILPAAPCAGATHAWLGSTTCSSLGSCNREFPPAGATMFVDPAFPPATLDTAHFRTIQAALDAAAPGAVIAVERGTYNEALTVRATVAIFGRCAEQVIITGDPTASVGLDVTGVRMVRAAGLSFVDHQRGVQVSGGGSLALDGVSIDRARMAGASAAGMMSELSITRSHIRDTQSTSSATGVRAEDGARVALEDLEVSGTVGSGLGVIGMSATMTGSRVVVRNSPQQGRIGGSGASVQGGRLALSDSAIIDSARYGVISAGEGSAAMLERVVVRGTNTTVGSAMNGLTAATGGSIMAVETHTSFNRGSNVLVEGTGSRARLERCSITNGLRDDSGIGGGVSTRTGGRVELLDSVVVANVSFSVAAVSAEFHAERSRFGLSSGLGAAGAVFGQMSRAELLDSFLGGSPGFELQTLDEGTIATLRRCAIDTNIAAVDRSTLALEESAIAGAKDTGIFADVAGTQVLVKRSVIERTRAFADPGGGQAVLVGGGAYALVEDSDLADNQDSAVNIFEASSSVDIVRSNVRGTQRDTEGKDGSGVDILGTMTAKDSAFVDNSGTGIFMREAAVADAIERSAFIRNGISGIYAYWKTRTVVRDSVFEDQRRSDSFDQHGVGILAGSDTTIEHTLFRRNNYAAIAVEATRNPGGLQLEIDSSILRDTSVDSTGFGHGLIIGTGVRAFVRGSFIYGNASMGLACSNASALVDSSVIAKNVVGVHVQDGSMLREVSEAPSEITPLEVLFTESTRLVDNGTRVGTGEIPVPAVSE